MRTAIAIARQRVDEWSWPRFRFDPPYFFELLPTCFLLALLFRWTQFIAPGVGLYFTASLALFLYSYLALMRAVYLRSRSYDENGHRSSRRRAGAVQEFHRSFRAEVVPLVSRWVRYAAVGALTLDLLTRNAQWPLKYATDIPIALAEIFVWWRYGPTIIIACTRWSPLVPLDLGAATDLKKARSEMVRGTFAAMAVVILFVSSAVTKVVYGPILAWIREHLPYALVWHLGVVGELTLLALFCLTGQALWGEWTRRELEKRQRRSDTAGTEQCR